MSKTLASIIEVGVGIALEFTPLAPIGTSLIIAGVSTIALGLLTHAPKPEQAECADKPPEQYPEEAESNFVSENIIMTGLGVGRRQHTERYEIDNLGAVRA